MPITSSFIGAAASSRPSSFIVAGSKIFFTADDAIHGREVWATDGTPAGTTLAADANPGSTGSYPTMIGSIGSAALFLAYDGTSTALWRSDATAAGTVRLMTVPPSTGGNGYAVVAVAADTKVYVLVRQGYSAPVQLFVSDGTVAGTREVGAFPLYLWPQPVGLGGSLFCVGQDASVGAQLWVTDGTAIGTHIVRRGVECPGSSCGPVPATFFRVGNRLLFLTSGALWRTDGTAAGTVQIAAIPVISTQPFTAPASPVAYFDRIRSAIYSLTLFLPAR